MANGHPSGPEIVIFPDAGSLSLDAAYRWTTLAGTRTRNNQPFTVALAGGHTPELLYSLLAAAPFTDLLDWTQVHLFFGDDRCVPLDSEYSNYRMAQETLGSRAPIPAQNIHRIPSEQADHEAAARAYEAEMRTFFGGDALPRFDLVLLGMGADGHCASLFPHKPALGEQTRWVTVSEPGLKPFVPRITLTFPVLNNAAQVLFMVAGEDKSETLSRVLEGPADPEALPSQSIKPTGGTLTWLVDRAAARLLSR